MRSDNGSSLPLPVLFERWVADKRARSRRGLAASSERAYRQDWNVLAARILTASGRTADGDAEPLAHLCLADLTDANLKTVISALEADGYTAASRARMLSAWRPVPLARRKRPPPG